MHPRSTPLAARLAAELAGGRTLPFRDWMARCLYDSTDGYYAAEARPVGRGGDFFTSVSVGPVFGELVADAVAATHRQLGAPADFALVEQGAHDGSLLADVLAGLEKNHPQLASTLSVTVVEPLPARRREQAERLERHGRRLQWVDSLENLPEASLTGFFFCNELLDAFPVDLLRREAGGWHVLEVGLGAQGEFSLVSGPAPAPFWQNWLAEHASALPVGALTEVSPHVPGWITQLRRVFRRGTAVVIDYGREAADYYRPERTEGTLRGYRQHQRCDDPFAFPGETDLTADVDFTLVRTLAESAGFRVAPLVRQEKFLLELAAPRLLSLEKQGLTADMRPWLRQFQTLTHPGHLGQAFHVLRLEV